MAGNRPRKSPDHWFEPIADHLGAAYLRYSFTKGTVQEVDHLVAALGLRPGDPRARRRVRSRAPCARARPAGDRRARHRHLASASSSWPPRRARRCDVRAARRPGADVRRRVRRRDLPLPGRVRADDRGGRGRGGRRRHGAGAAARRPAGLSAFNAYFAVKYHDDGRRSTPAPAWPTSAPRCATRPAPAIESTCGPGATRRGAAPAPRPARPRRRRGSAASSPARYGDDPPTTESPEFLVIAQRP